MTAGRTTFQVGFNAGVAGAAGWTSSSRPRGSMDFKPTESGHPAAFRSVTRARSGPAPGAQVQPLIQDIARLAGGQPLSQRQMEQRLMKGAVKHLLPGLGKVGDATLDAPVDALVARLMDLQGHCIAANEPGLFIERVLSTLMAMPHIREDGGKPDAESLRGALADCQQFVGQLATCLAEGAVQGQPTRGALCRALLTLAMPAIGQGVLEKWDPRRVFMSQQREALTGPLLDDLMRLHARFDGRPGYCFDTLLSALCLHADIFDMGQVPNAGATLQNVRRATHGLRTLVDVVHESLAPGSDGLALNGLIGIDPQLDKAIVSVRIDCVADCMRAQARREPLFGEPADLLASAQAQATELVQLECDVATARLRLMRAFDRAGVTRPAEVVRGLKMDAALVKGLCTRLDDPLWRAKPSLAARAWSAAAGHNHRASELGLAIMGMYLLERELAESPAAKRMCNDIRVESEPLRRIVQADDSARAQAEALAGRGPADPPLARDPQRDVVVLEQGPRLRRLDTRLATLADPGLVTDDVRRKLGVAGLADQHIGQLARQGLSSAAEARAVLHGVGRALQSWDADGGPQRMQAEGLIDVLRTRRQEDKAVTLGERLLQSLPRTNGRIDLPADAAGRQKALLTAVRAAVLHLLPVEQRNHGLKATPPLHAFQPSTQAIRGVLVAWGIDDELDQLIDAQILGGITPARLAEWVREADLPQASTPAAAPAGGDPLALLGARLLQLLPGGAASPVAITLPVGDAHAKGLVVRDAVRAAILAQPAAPTPPDAAAVAATLLAWGVDGAAAVIADELSGGVTPRKLEAWGKDADATEARQALVESLGDLKIGTRVRMSGVQRANLTTGRVGDTVGAGGRVAAARFTAVEFGNPGDPGGGYETIFRTGGELAVAAEGSVPATSLGQLKAGPFAGAQGKAQRFSGVALRFRTPADQQAVMERLLRKPDFDFDDLREVDSLMFVRDKVHAREVSAGFQAVFRPQETAFSWSDVQSVGLSVGARVVANWSVQRTTTTVANNKDRIERQERVTVLAAGAAVTSSVRVAATQSGEHQWSASVVEAGPKREKVVKESIRVFSRGDTAVDVESFAQSYVAGGSALELASKLGGPVYDQVMSLLRDAQPDTHAAVEALIAGVRDNELLSLASKLDANAGFYPANERARRSAAAREHRTNAGSVREDKAAAARMRKEADAILRDTRLHHLARVADIGLVDTGQSTSSMLGLLERTNTVVAASLPVEVKLTLANELVHIAQRARQELEYGLLSR